MKRIYFQFDSNMLFACFNGEPEYFRSMTELERYCIDSYGHDFELFEVTADNWQGLYDSGKFNS